MRAENVEMLKQKIMVALMVMLVFMAGNACNNVQKTSSDEAQNVYRGFEDFNINRGINISHWLSQSNRRGVEREEFFTREDMNLIASLGFDHIRLPIDEVQMWDDSGNKEKRAFELLHHALQWAMDEDMRIIVDLHIIRSHHFNLPENPLWTKREEQEKFVDLWRQLSAELKDYPLDKVAYELMNEPVADDPELWNILVAETIEAIRKTEPNRKIVVGSNRWQSVNTFKYLRIPENDRHIILSFHFYEPFLLTHHQASWTHIAAYDGPVRYPGVTVNPSDIDPDLPQNVIESLQYHNGDFTKETLAEMIQLPLDFAKKHNLPLYCGEFGCLPTVPRESLLAWYDDLIDIFEKNEIAWTKWDYKGGFGIINRDTGEENKDILDIILRR